MLDGYTRKRYPKMGGLVTCVPPTQVPLGAAVQAEDVEFTAQSVKTRDGITQVFQAENNQKINGLDVLVQQASAETNTQMLLVFGSDGTLYKEPSVGAASLEEIGDIGEADLYMQMTPAYDRAYMAFSDLITGQAAPKQYLKYQNQFFLDALGVDPADVADVRTALLGYTDAEAGAAAGDVPVGLFYMVVLFVTRSGYISGIAENAVVAIDVTVADKQLIIDAIPLGPTNCVARILAFTEVGMSSAGPYYYLPGSFTIEGLNSMITQTLIEDNTTTKVHLNFTTDTLRGGTDVTQYFDKMLVPNVVGARFLPTLRRIAYWGYSVEPSTIFMSEPDDPETLFETLSRINVAENNGQRIQTVFEFRSEVYAAKERGAHVLDPTNTYPSTWGVNERWTGVGPSGPRALDVCEEFVIFAHRSGAYKYEGSKPEWISWEHSGDSGLWKRINWAYGHLISVKIDTETKRVFFCVPLDQSTVPNKVIVLDYSLGFGTPLGQLPNGALASIEGRRWSIYNIPAAQILRAERAVGGDANVNEPDDNAQQESQLLLASSAADGAINMLDATSVKDNGHGIHSAYQFAYVQPGGIVQLGAYELSARGSGSIGITQLADEDELVEKKPVRLKNGKHNVYTKKTKGQADMWSLRIHTVDEGDWFDVDGGALWLNSIWPWTK